ncbi:hypothetical protein CAEBREN_26127 [Caenorhabditis brenneri]|uniref:Uncharacterized protein n=1 Tax=Caenorhabditis brenneri TaxID=135651 RepID=G0P4J5_CAEBE|nr:hypothetical protein CAEBREN_26127 [Caenorhabditis brenneri]
MIRILFTTFFIFLPVFSITITRIDEFQDLVLDTKYENLTTKGELQPELYRVLLDRENPPPAVRIVVTSEKASQQNPFTVTVVHGKTIHNLALPRIQSRDGHRYSYWFASDTLCDYDSSIEELGQPVQLSISSSVPSTFELRVKSVNDFHIGQEPILSRASPSEQRYYMYTFPSDVDKVDVKITSNSELCATIVARRVNCPLFDASGLLELSEVYYYQSFTTFGGFSLRKSDIGSQFHVAFTVNGDDSVCGTQSNTSDHGGGPARIKAATISVTPVAETSILSAIPLILEIQTTGSI